MRDIDLIIQHCSGQTCKPCLMKFRTESKILRNMLSCIKNSLIVHTIDKHCDFRLRRHHNAKFHNRFFKSVHTFFKEKVHFPFIDSSFQRLLNIAYMIGSQNFEVD